MTENRSDFSAEQIAKCLYIINRNAKTASKESGLYTLKSKTISKLLAEGKAKKVGLHYSPNPTHAQQRSDVLVQVGEYHFHIPAVKEDFEQLPHLGHWDQRTLNPKVFVPLREARETLEAYTGYQVPRPKRTSQKPNPTGGRASSYFDRSTSYYQKKGIYKK